MKVPVFVSSCAALLFGWLAVTYVREVPNENYPQLGRGSLPITAVEPAETAEPTPLGEEPLMALEEDSEESVATLD